MMKTEIKPVLDLEFLQRKANEAAMKGAKDAIEEFYSSYNSPYKKAIAENLKNKGVGGNFDIPDIVAVLNEKIATEIDSIANTAIAKTFIPFVKEFLTREAAEVKFSDILKKFIKAMDYDPDEDDQYHFTVEEVERYSESSSLSSSFPTYRIGSKKASYEVHLYANTNGQITIMSLPYKKNESGKYYSHSSSYSEIMKVSLDGGATLELPFTKGILYDEFTKYCARLVIGNTNIIMDTTEFDEDMFPDRKCHC